MLGREGKMEDDWTEISIYSLYSEVAGSRTTRGPPVLITLLGGVTTRHKRVP
jgi:hypothetical protein